MGRNRRGEGSTDTSLGDRVSRLERQMDDARPRLRATESDIRSLKEAVDDLVLAMEEANWRRCEEYFKQSAQAGEGR